MNRDRKSWATKIADEKPATEPPSSDYRPLRTLLINVRRWDTEDPPEQEWGAYNRFPARQSAILSGEGAVGKSMTLLHLAASHVLEHTDWLGAVLDHGPALFIDCEDETEVLWRRLVPIVEFFRKRVPDLDFAGLHARGLELISLAGHDPVMAHALRSGKLEVTKRYAELLEMAGDLKPKMIGIASSANVFAGNEIDRSQVQQFVGYLTRVAQVARGYVVLGQHPSLTGIDRDTGLSGSTQWHNAVRARAFMRGVKSEAGEQPDNDLREIVFKKNQYGRTDGSVVLRWQNGMFLPAPGVWSLDKAAAQQKADEIFVKLLRQANEQNRKVSTNPGTNFAPAVFARHPDAQGTSSPQFRDAMQRLLDTGAIDNPEYGPTSKRRTHLVVR